jgi:hypothetical protein
MLCRPPLPRKKTSTRPLILGVGPGTTATRSFALAVSLMGKEVLHYAVRQTGRGETQGGWKETLEEFHVEDMVRGMEFRDDWDRLADELDYLRLYERVDAVFDWPVPCYAVEILRAYPSALILMMHRDPAVWYAKRRAFCKGQHKPKMCDVPFLLRPMGITLFNMTEEQAVGSFEATEDVLQCIVPPERFLMVDAWNQPEEGWMPHIAEFIGVSKMPPPWASCTIPRSADHSLSCANDAACDKCRKYMRKHLQERSVYYLPNR